MPASDVPRALCATAEPAPLNTLIRLLFIGLPAPVEAVRAAIAPMSLETWTRAELLCPADAARPGRAAGANLARARADDGGRSALAAGLRAAGRFRRAARSADLATGRLEHRPALPGRFSDLGTGSGALALMIAPRAETVYATDSNARALAFTRFNLRLNGIENVQCLSGDLFEPVAERQFDLILCNPPFVISPTKRFSFRDSGERGDAFCRRLIAAAVQRLVPGGFFQCTGNIAHVADRTWKSDLEEWFAGLGCDVLVFVERVESAADYAMNWILSTESKDPRQVAERDEVWTDFFQRERIEAVSYLYITLRRGREASAGGGWIEIDDPPCRIAGPCGAEVLRFFKMRDASRKPAAAESLLDERLRVAPGIRLTQEYVAGEAGLELREIRIAKTGGLQYSLGIHPNVASLLAECNGRRTVRELLTEMVASLDLAWDQAVPVVLPAIRVPIERSVLVASET